MRITAVETFLVQITPHNPQGPISTAASIHLAAAIPNFRILEFANQLRLPGWAEVPARPGPVCGGARRLLSGRLQGGWRVGERPGFTSRSLRTGRGNADVRSCGQ